jgi:hypothetical protein
MGKVYYVMPWVPKTMWTVLTVAVLPVICYTVIIPSISKNKNMSILVILILMFLFGQVFVMLYAVFGLIANSVY